MKKNIGTFDQIVRLIVAAVIAALYFTNVISGTLAIILGIVAVMMVLTSTIRFCPLYLPYGIHTIKKK